MAKRRNKCSKIYFPFAPGIPWKLEMFQCILPQIESDLFREIITDKTVIIVAFGGLFETFASMAVAEALLELNYSREILWIGYQQYLPLIQIQGIMKDAKIDFLPEYLYEYPTPIFFDQEGNVYFNLLYRFLNKRSYNSKYIFQIKDKPVYKQIFENSTLNKWDNYAPILRNINYDTLNSFYSSGKISEKSRVIIIVMDPNINDSNDILRWGTHDIREFIQLVTNKGFKVVLFSNNHSFYYGLKCYLFDFDIKVILEFMSKSWMILSNSIDWLLISLLNGNNNIVSSRVNDSYDILKNAEYVNSENQVFIINNDEGLISPIEVFEICEGLVWQKMS